MQSTLDFDIQQDSNTAAGDDAIPVIGMAVRYFPGACTQELFSKEAGGVNTAETIVLTYVQYIFKF